MVNDEVISLLDLAMRTRLAILASGAQDTPQVCERLVPQVLRNLIDERLQMQEAARLDISVPDAQVDEAMQGLARQNGMSIDQFFNLLKSRGILPDALREQVQAGLTWRALALRRFRPQVSVTEEEIDEVSRRLESAADQPQYRVSEIFLAVNSGIEEPQVRSNAEQLIAQLNNGANFDGLARQFSQSAAAQAGGDLGWQQLSEMPQEVAGAVQQLQIGTVAGPIRSLSGFHIVRLTDSRQGGAQEEQVRLSQVVIALPEGASGDLLQAARNRAEAARSSINSCADVPAAAQQFGATGSGDLGMISMSDLPPDIQTVVRNLPIGAASQAVPVAGGLGVLVVCEREASGIDRDRIERNLIGQRIERICSAAASGTAPNRQHRHSDLTPARLDSMRRLRQAHAMAFTGLPEKEALPPLAVTMGEPAGIGGDIALTAWRHAQQQASPTPFFLLDDPERLAALAQRLDLTVPLAEIARPEEAAACFRSALPVLPVRLAKPATPGRPDSANAEAVIAAIDKAVALAMAGRAAAVVTNPIHKKTLYEAGFQQPGHTEYLALLTGRLTETAPPRPVMMLAGPLLRVVPVTVHVPLADAVRQLSREDIVETARITARSLQRDFAVARPRLAVAGLNPHAGESGALGREDLDLIAPAIAALNEELGPEGVAVTGPHPADSLFHAAARERYDAAVCMYHDQALIPVKTLDFDRTVNVTLGLPFVRCSPDHGAALDIAGQGIARPDSLIAAIALADSMARRRSAATADSA